MIILYFISFLCHIFGFYTGIRSEYRIHRTSTSKVLKSLLLLTLFITLMSIAWNIGILSFFTSSLIMVIFYSLISGYLFGYGVQIYQKRKNHGQLLYVSRSFLTDHIPAVASFILILFGFYRTSLLTEIPVTGIRVSSGLSLMAAGFLGFTLRIIPELREKGILMLDLTITWKQVIAWEWQSENIVSIECMMDNSKSDSSENARLKIVTLRIPDDQKMRFEAVMKKKTDEFREERQAYLKSMDQII